MDVLPFITKAFQLCNSVFVLVPIKRNSLHCVQPSITLQLQLNKINIPAVVLELVLSAEFSFRFATYLISIWGVM